MAADREEGAAEDAPKEGDKAAEETQGPEEAAVAPEEAAKGKPEPRSRRGRSPEGGEGSNDPMEQIVKLMQDQHFGRAAAQITKMLKKTPDDPVLLHNLGVIYTEQSRWAEAEETFMSAFEAQKKANKLNYATLFGLGVVLTEQGGMGKLMQAEALFRDCLVKAIAQEEKGVLETYRAFTSLGENLGLQKRWGEASEAYTQALEMGTRMFGPEHERNIAQQAVLDRAKRLARIQKYMRGALWVGTASVPVICAWMWNYLGGPSLGEIFQFLPISSHNASAAGGLPDASALGADSVPAPQG